MPVGQALHLRDRLHGADLVVRPHDGYERRPVTLLRQYGFENVQAERRRSVYRYESHVGTLLRRVPRRLQACLVLDLGDEHARSPAGVGPNETQDGEVARARASSRLWCALWPKEWELTGLKQQSSASAMAVHTSGRRGAVAA